MFPLAYPFVSINVAEYAVELQGVKSAMFFRESHHIVLVVFPFGSIPGSGSEMEVCFSVLLPLPGMATKEKGREAVHTVLRPP